MGKIKISKEHEISLPKQKNELKPEDFDKVKRLHPTRELTNFDKTALAIFECLLNNDPAGAMEMVELYLSAVNKARLTKKANLSKSTMYSALKRKNPTIKTLAKILSSSTSKKKST